MNLEQVKDFIKNSDRETLSEIARIFNQSINNKIKAEADQFKQGDEVTIDHHSVPAHHIYRVIRVNRKSVTVKSAIRQLKVAPKFLKKYNGPKAYFPELATKIKK